MKLLNHSCVTSALFVLRARGKHPRRKFSERRSFRSSNRIKRLARSMNNELTIFHTAIENSETLERPLLGDQ